MSQVGAIKQVFDNEASKTPPKPRKPLAPFSLRLTEKERARLEAEAGSRPLGAYIRSRLLGAEAEKRRIRRSRVTDYEELAALLAQLGRSHLASNLNQLAKAANSGSLPVTLEITKALLDACQQVQEMRDALIAALGIKPEDGV